MRIGMVLMGNFPPDIRVEKELKTLTKKHDIFLLCNGRKGEILKENRDSINIRRVPLSFKRSISQFDIFTKQKSKFWFNIISNFVKTNNIEILHVHDLPLVGVSKQVALIYGIKVVADLHENYPAMLKENARIPYLQVRNIGNFTLKLFYSERNWRKFESSVLHKCDAIITVIEEAKIRLLKHKLDSTKIFVVPNYNLISKHDTISSNVKPPDDSFSLIYAGGVAETRDLSTLIKSLVNVKFSKPRLKLIIVGANSSSKIRLENIASTHGVQDLVEVLEWVSREKAEALMNQATVGLVPHRKSEHTDTTIPHKLFQYMYRSMPVIVSNCEPLERIVVNSNCGLVYESGNSLSLSKCINTLYNNSSLCSEFGENGRSVCIKKFNWDYCEKVLLDMYSNLS